MWVWPNNIIKRAGGAVSHTGGYTKDALARVQLYLVLSEGGKLLLQVIQMGKFFFTLNEHVIHIHLHILANLLAEHFVH